MIILGVIAAIDALHRGVQIGPLDPVCFLCHPNDRHRRFRLRDLRFMACQAQTGRAQASDFDRHHGTGRRSLWPLSVGAHRNATRGRSDNRPWRPATHSCHLRTRNDPPSSSFYDVGCPACLRVRRSIGPNRNDSGVARLCRISQLNYRKEGTLIHDKLRAGITLIERFCHPRKDPACSDVSLFGLQPVLAEHDSKNLTHASDMAPANAAGFQRVPRFQNVALSQRTTNSFL